MTETNLTNQIKELKNAFDLLSVNAYILARYSSPVKNNLTTNQELINHYLSEETELILTNISQDLIESLEELRDKINELTEMVKANDVNTAIEKLNKLID